MIAFAAEQYQLREEFRKENNEWNFRNQSIRRQTEVETFSSTLERNRALPSKNTEEMTRVIAQYNDLLGRSPPQSPSSLRS